jgi:hypothetical protein
VRRHRAQFQSKPSKKPLGRFAKAQRDHLITQAECGKGEICVKYFLSARRHFHEACRFRMVFANEMVL